MAKGKLLYLTYFFPPLRGSPCVRTWATAKYLARLGWDVTVLTIEPSQRYPLDDPTKVESALNSEGIKTWYIRQQVAWVLGSYVRPAPSGVLRRLAATMRRAAKALQIDAFCGWKMAVRRAARHLAPGAFDVVLTSAGPFCNFGLAMEIADRIRCPFLMDYRDPWTAGIPHYSPQGLRAARRQEGACLAKAAAVSIVSPSWGALLDDEFHCGAKLKVISNGYDPELLGAAPETDFGHAALVYAGGFRPPKRVIDPVLEGMAHLESVAPMGEARWLLHYYGPHGTAVEACATRLKVSHRVRNHNEVARAEVLAALKGSAAGIVIATVGRETAKDQRGIVTGKVFEMLGLGIPVLAIAPPESDLRLAVGDNGLCATGDETDRIASFFRQVVEGKRQRFTPPIEYSWPHLASMLSELLEEAVGRAKVAS